MSAVLIPFPTPRRASSFDAVLAAMDAAGTPNGRIVAQAGRIVDIDWQAVDAAITDLPGTLAAMKAARPVSPPAIAMSEPLPEAECERIDAAVHQLKTRGGGWAWEQDRADHAQRRDGR